MKKGRDSENHVAIKSMVISSVAGSVVNTLFKPF